MERQTRREHFSSAAVSKPDHLLRRNILLLRANSCRPWHSFRSARFTCRLAFVSVDSLNLARTPFFRELPGTGPGTFAGVFGIGTCNPVTD
jgi:hypothetical protein